MRKFIIFSIFSLALSVSAYCAQASRIELTDGSVINGEIVSLADGVYTINTAFGKINIGQAKVSKIETGVSTPAAPLGSSDQPTGLSSSQIDAYKDKLMSDPEKRAAITNLAADPQIQGLAQDPAVQDAVKSGNIQALMQNEKFMGIVNDPQMQEKMKKLKQKE